MKLEDLIHIASRTLVGAALFAALVTPAAAQRTGAAAGGGSVAYERVRGDNSRALTIDEPALKKALAVLQLDYHRLMAESLARDRNEEPLDLTSVTLAHLIVRAVNPADSNNSLIRLIESLRRTNSLDTATHRTFGLTRRSARKYVRGAERQLRQAVASAK